MIELPVQRLVLILPPGEQPQELLEGLKDFPPMPRGGQLQRARVREARGEDPEREAPAVVVQQPEAEDVIRDLPRPQRATRGRPRRAL